MLIAYLLVISILAGQLIKIPVFGVQGPTLLDLLVLALSLIGIAKLKFKLQKPNKLLKIGYLFTGVGILSLIVTPLSLNFPEYLSSFSYTLRFFVYILFAHIIFSGAFEDFRKRIKETLIYSGVGLAVLGLIQFLILPDLMFLQPFGWDPHYFRTVSTFLDPNFAGAYFVLTLLLLTSLRGHEVAAAIPKKIASSFTLLAMTIVYLALLTTFSRSSYLMFLVSGISLAFFQKSKKILLGTFILFIGLLIGFQIYTQAVATPRGINREQSASFRLSTWQQGLTIFQHSPLMGVGFNTYKFAIREYNLSDSQFLESRGSTTNDFSLLYVLATTGIVGLTVYLLFILHLPPVAILGLLIHSIFANSLFYPPIFLWIILLGVKKESI